MGGSAVVKGGSVAEIIVAFEQLNPFVPFMQLTSVIFIASGASCKLRAYSIGAGVVMLLTSVQVTDTLKVTSSFTAESTTTAGKVYTLGPTPRVLLSCRMW